MEGKDILALPMQDNDARAATIKDYLIALLRKLWADGESFSGKRPFGNSGWDQDLTIPLVVAGVIDGTMDEDGYIDNANYNQANAAIEAL